VYFEMLQMVRLYEQQSKKHDGTYLVTLAFFSCFLLRVEGQVSAFCFRARGHSFGQAPRFDTKSRRATWTGGRYGQSSLEVGKCTEDKGVRYRGILICGDTSVQIGSRVLTRSGMPSRA
jgi:hypothetical protein